MGFISDLLIEITSFRIRVGNKLNKLWEDIGNKANLTTTDKSSLVNAINEVNGRTSGGVRNYWAITKNAWHSYLKYEGGYLFSNNHTASAVAIFRMDKLNLPLNEQYTVSFEIKVKTSNIQFQNSVYYVNSALSVAHNKPTLVLNEWVKVEATFFYAIENTTFTHIYISGITAIDQYEIRNFKVEKGNKSTDWTPAPEDQVSDWNETDSNKYSFIKNKPSIPNGQLTVNTTSDLVGGYVYLPSGNVTTTLGLATHVLNAIVDGQTAYSWGNFRDYGLGTIGMPERSDVSAINNTGFYRINNSNTTVSGAPTAYGSLIHLSRSGNEKIDMFFDASSDNMYFKRILGSTVGKWRRLWHSGNFNPAQYVLQTSLNTQLANYATKAGTQTFTGQNTFTQAIYTPAATLNGHAVNLGQLNTAIASVTYTLPTASATVLGGIKVGNNLTIDANGVLSATDTNTTYSAGTGLTLSGTTFGQTIATNGYGSVVTGITQTSNGFQVNYGNLGINTEVKVYYHGEINNGDTIFCTASKTIMYLSPMFSGPLHIKIEPELMNGSELIIIHNYTGSGPGFFNLVGNFIGLTGQEVSSFLASQGKYMRLIYVKDVGRFAFVDGGQI